MVEGRDDVIVSELAVTETVSAVARRLREGALTGDVVDRVGHALVAHLDAGRYRRVELTRDVHRLAERFLRDLTGTPLRALDALHLALATSARAASLASFDARLRAAARATGLVLYPG